MAGRLLSLHTSPTSLSSKLTTTKHASDSSFFFFSPARGTMPSRRTLQLERRHRVLVPVPRAGGAPSTSTLLFVFFLPISLVVGTVLAAMRIGKDLDDKYVAELNKALAMMEEDEMEFEEEFEEDEDEIPEALKDNEFVRKLQKLKRRRPRWDV